MSTLRSQRPPSLPSLLALAATLLPGAAAADGIDLDDVRVAPGTRSAVVDEVPWSGSWWPFALGELSQGTTGHANFDYDAATERFRARTLSEQHLSPLRKYDLYSSRRHGERPGAARLELEGDPASGFHHHVHGARKAQLDRDGVDYSWWGHCNGWAAASVMEREPVSPVTLNGIRFEVADLKGLLSESYFSVHASFLGTRFDAIAPRMQALLDEVPAMRAGLGAPNGPSVATLVAWYQELFGTPIDPTVVPQLQPHHFLESLRRAEDYSRQRAEAYADLRPEVFHRLLVTQIEARRRPVVFDTSAGAEVWNFPAYAFTTTISPAGPSGRFAVRTVVTYAHDGVDPGALGVTPLQMEYTYELACDADGRPVSGTWTGASVDAHPDFAWIPTWNPPGVDRGENPSLLYSRVQELLTEDSQRTEPRRMQLLAAQPDGGFAQANAQVAPGQTTSLATPAQVLSPVQLQVAAPVQGPIAQVRYYQQQIQQGQQLPTAPPLPLRLLGQSPPGGQVRVAMDQGPAHILAQGIDASGRLVSTSAMAIQVQQAPVTPPAPPATDRYEPNDTHESPAQLTAGTHAGLFLSGAADWYELPVQNGEVVSVTLRPGDGVGALAWHVYSVGPMQELIVSGGQEETFTRQATQEGRWLLSVWPHQDASQAPYALQVTQTPAPPPADDPFEPNDTREDAKPLAPGTHQLQVLDHDWFRLDLVAGQYVEVDLRFRHAEADLDLAAYEDRRFVAESSGTSDEERVEFVAERTGAHYLQVLPFNGQAGAELTVQVGAPPSGVEDGRSQATAYDLSEIHGMHDGNGVAPGRPRWRKVLVPADTAVHFSLSYRDPDDLTLTVVGADGVVLPSAPTPVSHPQRKAWIHYNDGPARWTWARVDNHAASGNGSPWTFYRELEPVDEHRRRAALEANLRAVRVDLSPGVDLPLQVTGNQQVFFRVPAAAGSRLVVNATGGESQGGYQVRARVHWRDDLDSGDMGIPDIYWHSVIEQPVEHTSKGDGDFYISLMIVSDDYAGRWTTEPFDATVSATLSRTVFLTFEVKPPAN